MVLLRRMKVMVSSDSSVMSEGLYLPILVRLSMLGLDFFPVWSFTGIFCYLLVLSGVVVGDSSLAMVVGILCGGFDTGDVLLDDFFCVSA